MMYINNSTYHHILFSILIFLSFSCKQENNEPLKADEKPMEISTSSFSEISSKSVKLYAQVDSLSSEKIIDAGFLILTTDQYGVEKGEKEFSIGNNIVAGELTYNYKPNFPFEQNLLYSYQFYIRTANKYYLGNKKNFVFNNLTVNQVLTVDSYGRDTIVVMGNFEEFDERYKLEASGAFNLYHIPFKLSADKKSLSFIVGHSQNNSHRNDLEIFISRQGTNVHTYRQRVATIKYYPKLQIKSFPNKVYDYFEFYSNNVGQLADNDPRLKIIINDIEFPFTRYFTLSDIEKLKGTTFKIGYKNQKETVFFTEDVQFRNPAGIKAELSRLRVHPTDSYSLNSEEYWLYFFAPVTEVRVGNTEVVAHYDQWKKRLDIQQFDIPEGQYDLVSENRFYNYIYPQKLKVEELLWSKLDKPKAFFGEIITASGNFIDKKDYIVFDQNDDQLGYYKAENGSLKIEVTNRFEKVTQIKIGYPYDFEKDRIIPYSQPFVSTGFTFEEFYPKRGMIGDIITVEGKGIAYAEVFLLGDKVLAPIVINKNKVTFSIPAINGSGKMRINYKMNGKNYQVNEYFELYIPAN